VHLRRQQVDDQRGSPRVVAGLHAQHEVVGIRVALKERHPGHQAEHRPAGEHEVVPVVLVDVPVVVRQLVPDHPLKVAGGHGTPAEAEQAAPGSYILFAMKNTGV